jgi:thiamine biosynthesis lipoprotein
MPTAAVQVMEGRAQGTTYNIRYLGAPGKDLHAQVDQLLKDFDKVFSNYRPDSDISRFNAQDSLEWFPVATELAELVQFSLDVSKKSEGAFDITIGALIKEWGFGPWKTKQHVIPSQSAIDAAKARGGWQNLDVRLKPPALRKKVTGLLVDLSGVAQGHAVDRVAQLLLSQGVNSFMVELGGEVITRGQKEGGQDWRIAIEAPQAERGEVVLVIAPRGQGLATSGDYRAYFEEKGKRYSHIIDPRRGRPIEHKLASVSVLAKTCTDADAYAKVFMVLGPEEAERLAERLKMPVFLISHQGAKDFTSKNLGGFERYIAP